MDRDSFPTLTESDTGWPVLNIPLSRGQLSIEVSEGNYLDPPVPHVIWITGVERGDVLIYFLGESGDLINYDESHPE